MKPSKITRFITIKLGYLTKFSNKNIFLTFSEYSHEINQFCSKHTLQEVFIDKFDSLDEQLASALQDGCNKWAPGIEVIAIRVTKPRIPETLLKNYEKIEAAKT
jgi:erlin